MPGWEAISAAADRLYPGLEPQHWGTIVRWRTGGPDPLDGISAYPANDPPHWHFVSYGLSELYEKESQDPALSGWGLELTMRVARDPAETAAPLWVVNVLQNLARYVFQSGNVLRPGDHTDAHGSIALDEATDLTAFLFVRDVQLGSIETPYGAVTFVQVVGISADEYRAAREWNSDALADLLRATNPLLVTDLRRPSIRKDSSVEAQIRTGIERDGSSMTGMKVDVLEVIDAETTLTIRLGALEMQGFRGLLVGRTRHDRTFWIDGPIARLAIQPGTSLSWHHGEGREVHVDLPTDLVETILEHVPATAGTFVVGEERRIAFEVSQTIIRDHDDREIEHIG